MRDRLLHSARRQATAGWLASVLAATTVAAGCASSLPLSSRSGVPDRETRAIHLLNRATYGARPQDVQEVLRYGIDGWLERQLQPGPHPPIIAEVAPATTGAAEPPQMLVTRGGNEPITVVRVADAQSITNLVFWKLERAVKSQRQLEEVMTDFWFNHFNVDYNKSINVRYAIADYEEKAIRPHVFGKFEDMLRATAQHPAMLVYLDNYLSTAPVTEAQQQRAPPNQRRGLNENYARELLELHTLGVEGGYTQQDVIEVARAFTGWSIVNRTVPAQVGNRAVQQMRGVDFQYHPERHDRGEKIVLGRKLPAERDMADAQEVLGMLAHHPSTAQHIAAKLVRHFVADDPPRELVDQLAAVFRKTNGDLREVTRALFAANAFYDSRYYRGKVKRPFEFVASALRVSGALMNANPAVVTQLRGMGHTPYSEPAPTGYPTTMDAWLSAGAMISRVRFALDASAGRIPNVRIDPPLVFGEDAARQFARWFPQTRTATPMSAETRGAFTAALLARTLPGVRADDLRVTIEADLAQQNKTDPKVIVPRALGLVLGSPEFQRF